MTCTIRSASVADVPAMHRLRNAVRENRLSAAAGITEASYLPYIDAGSAWVADRPDGIAGFAAIDPSSETVWALFVDPETEGAGIGRALHSAMLGWAREQGVRRLSLTTETGSRAMHFYERAGWTQAATTADGEVTFERSLLILHPAKDEAASSAATDS